MYHTKGVEKIETRFMFNDFFFENRTDYEVMWKNFVERDRLQVTIWRMRIAWWIPKATNTHSGCVIIIAFSLQKLQIIYITVVSYIQIANDE